MKKIIITEQMQLDIFEDIFSTLIEKPSMRDMLKKMIESKERVAIAEIDLMLAKLSVEIYDKNKGENYEEN